MIDIQKIVMHYGFTVALDGVSFTVREGEVLGLLGPNGAGKSTLMKILTSFITPLSGTVKVKGIDVATEPLKARSVIGYLPENVPLYMDMRVDEYLRFVGEARCLQGRALETRLSWVLEACGLVSVWKHGIHELSKGFRQRVGLAQALIHDPDVLILDEPTNGLDPVQILSIRKLVRSLAQGRTILFSTHILQEVDAIADEIVIIHEGRIIARGTKTELAVQAGFEKAGRMPTLEEVFIASLNTGKESS